MGLDHDLVPDRRGDLNAIEVSSARRMIIRVAGPDSDRQIRGVAHCPQVARVFRRTGLCRDRAVKFRLEDQWAMWTKEH